MNSPRNKIKAVAAKFNERVKNWQVFLWCFVGQKKLRILHRIIECFRLVAEKFGQVTLKIFVFYGKLISLLLVDSLIGFDCFSFN